MLRRADFLDRIPILAPRFGFAGLQKTEVRLVVSVNACHDFDIGGKFAALIGVGQIPIPRITEFMIAPCPLFFSGRNVVVRNMDDARLRFVIVAAKKIFLAAHAHVRRGHGNVGIEATRSFGA